MTKAIDVSQKAFRAWESTPLEQRAEIFIRAAELIRGKYRYDMLAATILGQAKTVFQAEIDAICELSDFYAYDAQWALVSGKHQRFHLIFQSETLYLFSKNIVIVTDVMCTAHTLVFNLIWAILRLRRHIPSMGAKFSMKEST